MMKRLLAALFFGVSVQAVLRDPNHAQWFGTETIAVKVAADAFTIFIAVLLGAYVSDYLYGKGRKSRHLYGKGRKGNHHILR